MEDARDTEAALAGDVLEEKVHDDAGDATTVVAGAEATAADLVEKRVAGSDSIVLDLEVKVSSGAVDACVHADNEQVVEEEEDPAGNNMKLAKAGFNEQYDPDFIDDHVYKEDIEEEVTFQAMQEHLDIYDVEDAAKEYTLPPALNVVVLTAQAEEAVRDIAATRQAAAVKEDDGGPDLIILSSSDDEDHNIDECTIVLSDDEDK
ncbi:hypothetical protein D1007_01857 [Hordeum vulgare]|nr:hypothetical protein D1007_01857 [Hordeum vulgare]